MGGQKKLDQSARPKKKVSEMAGLVIGDFQGEVNDTVADQAGGSCPEVFRGLRWYVIQITKIFEPSWCIFVALLDILGTTARADGAISPSR